jgi:hypothetical protein
VFVLNVMVSLFSNGHGSGALEGHWLMSCDLPGSASEVDKHITVSKAVEVRECSTTASDHHPFRSARASGRECRGHISGDHPNAAGSSSEPVAINPPIHVVIVGARRE